MAKVFPKYSDNCLFISKASINLLKIKLKTRMKLKNRKALL
jgi:hypothetical protein